MTTQEQLTELVKNNKVVLFMKGTPDFPHCGFSAKAIALLNACGVEDFHSVNVLDDDEVRQGIKTFSDWPTIPQLYVNAEFIGGSDILQEMYDAGDLQKVLA